MDASKAGEVLGELVVGGGIDNIDYLQSKHLLYIASGKSGTLTVAVASLKGNLSSVATAPTAEGGKVVVVDSAGNSYIRIQRAAAC